MEGQDKGRRSFAHKLQFLFDAVHNPDGRRYSIAAVTDAMNANGHICSRTYLSALKEGTKPTPSRAIIEALASFFHVPLAYFLDEEVNRWMEEELRLVASLRGSTVRAITLHSHGLSEKSLDVLLKMAQTLRDLEGLAESVEQPPRRKRRRREELFPVQPSNKTRRDADSAPG